MDTRYILGLLAALILGWFAVGIIFNLRRGEALLRWMQGGLPKIGERTTLRWLGSSVAELVIGKAKGPFRRLETLVVLAPRDVPWMWLWSLLRGRRDTLILRGLLAAPPDIVLELADPTSWTGRQALQELFREGWEPAPSLSANPAFLARRDALSGLQLVTPQGRTHTVIEALPGLLAILEQLTPRYSRFSVRRDPPSLEIHMPFPNPRTADAGAFFEALRSLARTVSKTNGRE